VFGALFALIVVAVLAAPLYASEVAGTTPSENHLTEQTVIDGKSTVIFGLPGVGALTADTIGTFDLPPIVALAVYLALVVVLFSALVDVVVAWLDPRLRRPGPST
jgi:hypothetical protein